jgi:hypothetical protein
MSGGVPKRVKISKIQANTYCKSGGKDKAPGLALCSGRGSRTAMCNYIKKRTNTKLSPYAKFIATGATMRIDGEYTIYDFTSNGQLTMEQVTVDEANSIKRCGPPIVGAFLEYFMVGGGGAGSEDGGFDSGGGGAGGVVRTGYIPVPKNIINQKLNIEVGLGGDASNNIGPLPMSGLPGEASRISYVGTGSPIVTATGGGGGNPNSGFGTGTGGSNADYNGGAELPLGGTQAGGGAGSAGNGQPGSFGSTPPTLANGGLGTSIPANYGISDTLGAGGGAGGPYAYPVVGGVPPPFFGFGGAHIGTEGPGDGGGALYLADPSTGTAADNKPPKDGRDGYGEGGGGGGANVVLPNNPNAGSGGSGRVLIRFKHL